MENIKYSDSIETLPTSDYQPSYNEMNIMNSLFEEKNSKTINKIAFEFKDVAIEGVIFAFLAAPISDKYIQKFIPFTSKSPYYVLALKTVVFIILIWVIQNKNLFFNN